ncbi:MAG TPA: hypothetical protein VLA24_09260 [Pseudomonadales bacterium]|nr:hypothetical protein [Pseudomonadales bacterium]
MELKVARQVLTELGNRITHITIEKMPEDAGRNWHPEMADEFNTELNAIEEQIDALRCKLYDLQA